MRFWISGLMLLPLATFAANDDKRCTVSFDAAALDVCTGELRLAHESLRTLGRADSVTPFRIVKFGEPIRAEQRSALETQGVKILGYAPHYAYLVRMDAATESRVKSLPGLIWTGAYLPVWKLDINLANDIANALAGNTLQSISAEAGIEQLSVALQPGVEAGRSRNGILAAPGLTYELSEKSFDHERVVVGFERSSLADAVLALVQNPDVASVSLRWPQDFMNSQAGWLHQSGQQTPLADSLPVFERGIFGCGQVVAAADSGLAAGHCSFSDPLYPQAPTTVCPTGSSCPGSTPDFNHRKVAMHYKWDGSTSGEPADNATSGHGTHVMGTMTGNNPAGAVDCTNFTTPGGLTDLDGTAPGAKLISQEMGSSLQYLNNLGGTIFHAAEVAYDNGARIHNNSWGSSCRNSIGACIAGCQVEYRSTTRDADAVVWEHPELAVLVSAGNSGGLGGNSGCGPGADVGAAGNAKNVFSIGSNNRGTGGNAMSGFSSRGPTQDRRIKPDMTAQGASILSASRTSSCGTSTLSGTSMAAPTAAGLAALVREYLARGFYPSGRELAGHSNGNPSAALVKAIMLSGTVSITGTGSTGGAPSQSQGWGRIHLDNSLHFQGDARNLWLQDGKTGLETEESEEYELDIAAGQPLTVVLTWHDAPALVNANPHTVNRLRLEVVAPNGDVWTQKLPAGGGLTNPNPVQDTTTANYDDTNNVHKIRIDAPAAGTYLIRVRGIAVAQGPQPYAVAATGSIEGLDAPDFLLTASPSELSICAGDPVDFSVGVFDFEGFSDSVGLSASGIPAAAGGAFSAVSVTPTDPAATSVFSLTDSSVLESGEYTLSIQGQSNGPGFSPRSKTLTRELRVAASTPMVAALIAPANTANRQSPRPAFSWEAFEDAASYRFELATDAAFEDVVIDTTLTSTSFTPNQDLLPSTGYFWRVSASNTCGTSQYTPTFTFRTAPLVGSCEVGQAAAAVFEEAFTGGLGAFTTTGSTGAQTWAVSTARPSPLSGGNAAFAANIATVSDQRLTSPVISLPASAGSASVRFQNWRHIEANGDLSCYDGGVLEISANGGPFTQVAAPGIPGDRYRGPVANGFQNPLAGLQAWCEPTARGHAETIADLSSYLGQDVQLRWRLGTDSEVAREGWYVDDIRVDVCSAVEPGVFANGFESPTSP